MAKKEQPEADTEVDPLEKAAYDLMNIARDFLALIESDPPRQDRDKILVVMAAYRAQYCTNKVIEKYPDV